MKKQFINKYTSVLFTPLLITPLIFGVTSCNNKTSTPIKITEKTIDGIRYKNAYANSDFKLNTHNNLNHLNTSWTYQDTKYLAGECLQFNSDVEIKANYAELGLISGASITNTDINKVTMTFKGYYQPSNDDDDIISFGIIALDKNSIKEDKDFTLENYPSSLVNEMTITDKTSRKDITLNVQDIPNNKFDIKYSARSFAKVRKGNQIRAIYSDYMPYYSSLSVNELAIKELANDQDNVNLNAYAQSVINIKLGDKAYIDIPSTIKNENKVITSSSVTINNDQVNLSVDVNISNFTNYLGNEFKSIIFNRIKVDEFTQNYNAGKVNISFIMPKNTINYTDNFYESDFTYDESIMLIAETDSNGKVISAPKAKLIFEPREIVSCKWYYHNNRSSQPDPTINLVNGVDYHLENGYIVANGTINNGTFTPARNIPFVLDKQLTGEINSFPGLGSPNVIKNKYNSNWYVPFTEYNELVQLQLSVSYTHMQGWDGDRQEYLGDSTMKKVVDKFKNKENVNLLIIGASNSTGANTSGYLKINPYMDSWMKQVVDNLNLYYHNNINYENRASGGTCAIDSIEGGRGWIDQGHEICQPSLRYMLGLDATYDDAALKAKYPTAEYKGDRFKNVPDLVFIEYGINDPSRYGVDQYKVYMKSIINSLYEKNPNVSILIFSGMYVNPISANHTFEEDCHAACRAFKNQYPSLDTINLSSMVQSIMNHGKNYSEMGANNINHFNDFITRVAASMFINALVKR